MDLASAGGNLGSAGGFLEPDVDWLEDEGLADVSSPHSVTDQASTPVPSPDRDAFPEAFAEAARRAIERCSQPPPTQAQPSVAPGPAEAVEEEARHEAPPTDVESQVGSEPAGEPPCTEP